MNSALRIPHSALAKPLPPFIRELRDAIRAKRKWQTRRVIKNPTWFACLTGDCPHNQPGDICYLREPLVNINGWAFYADDEQAVSTPTGAMPWKWQVNKLSQLYLPRYAASTFVVIEAVRAQRLQDITEADAIADGVGAGFQMNAGWPDYLSINKSGVCERTFDTAKHSFQSLWDSINSERGYPWTNNDWVWAYTFKLTR